MAPRLKIGFLGGSFDPVHFGHLIAAQDASKQHQLDRLFFVPAAQAPLKAQDAHAAPEDRLAMLRAAIEWDKRFEISDVELKRGGLSYTIDTVRHFRTVFPGDSLYWIIGGDQLPRLHLWKDVGELAQLIEFILLERPGHPSGPGPAIPGLRLHRCGGHLIDISSNEMRERVRRGLPLNDCIPPKVICYIQQRKLYL